MNFLDGQILTFDKAYGITSFGLVAKVRWLITQKMRGRKIKVGHAGTLDPLATGVLLVCIGKATKMVNDLQAEEKEYIADIELGATTPSYDLEHPIDKRYPTEHITREMIEQALRDLTGERLQAPPIYSAKKVEGVRAYEFARQGEEVELKKALINIYSLTLEEYDLPKIRIRVECSKGTYIRSLAGEIGEAVNSGAYLTSLRRTASGEFKVENAWQLEDFLKKLSECETKR